MDDNDTLLTSGNESSGHGSEEHDSSGDSGDGAADRGQESGGAGGTPAKTNPSSTDNSTSDDDDSDPVLKALMAGSMDDIGDDGEPKKPAAKAEKTEVADEKSETPEETDADEKAEDKTPEKAKDEPVELSDEDKAELAKAPKAYRKEFAKLFEERHKNRDELSKTKESLEGLKPVKEFTDSLIKHAAEAGLVVTGEKGVDASALRDLIEQERMLKGKSSKEIAAYYRDLANDLDPDSVPVSIPQELKDLVDLGTLKEEDALVIARKRAADAKKPELDQRRLRDDAARKEQQTRDTAAQAVNKAKADGVEEIKAVAKRYHKRFGAEWDAIAVSVEAKLEPLMLDTNPKAWAKLAETVIEGIIAGRKTALKTPTKTPTPGQKPSKIASDVMTEEEENEALASGKSLR